MEERYNPYRTAPEGYRALSGLQRYVNECGLEAPLLELVKLRASQINGCAACLAMHLHDARKLGESEERILLLNAWREAPIYSAREQAALAWTEAITLVTDGHVPDEIYAAARRQFSDKELADLTFAIVTINAWNRMSIAFRVAPQVKQPHTA